MFKENLIKDIQTAGEFFERSSECKTSVLPDPSGAEACTPLLSKVKSPHLSERRQNSEILHRSANRRNPPQQSVAQNDSKSIIGFINYAPARKLI